MTIKCSIEEHGVVKEVVSIDHHSVGYKRCGVGLPDTNSGMENGEDIRIVKTMAAFLMEILEDHRYENDGHDERYFQRAMEYLENASMLAVKGLRNR